MHLHKLSVAVGLSGAMLLAACVPTESQTRLDLAPAFYPSAIAFDRRLDQYVVGSYQSGEVLALLKGGQSVARLRAGTAGGEPVLRLAMDEGSRQVWVGLPGALEVISRQDLSTWRLALPGAFIADLAVVAPRIAYVLDAGHGQLLRVDADSRQGTVVANIPDAGDRAGQRTAGIASVAERMVRGGSLLALPDRRTLLIADGGSALWRYDIQAGRMSLVVRDAARLRGVTQLVAAGGDARGYRVLALSGMANSMLQLTVARDFSGAVIQPQGGKRLDTPLRAAYDGTRVQVLLGWLRHHPDLHGDGRPAMPARVVSYVPLDDSLHTASAGALSGN